MGDISSQKMRGCRKEVEANASGSLLDLWTENPLEWVHVSRIRNAMSIGASSRDGGMES